MTDIPKPDDDEFEDAQLGESGAIPVTIESLGSRMTEAESYERVIEGLKQASDSCQHMAAHCLPDHWKAISKMLIQARYAMVAMHRGNKPEQAAEKVTSTVHAPMSEVESFKRVINGIKQAAGGARQVAVYHRKDERWLDSSMLLEEIEGKCKSLMKQRQLALAGQVIPPGARVQ